MYLRIRFFVNYSALINICIVFVLKVVAVALGHVLPLCAGGRYPAAGEGALHFRRCGSVLYFVEDVEHLSHYRQYQRS